MQQHSSGYNDIYSTQEDIVEDIKIEENVYFLFLFPHCTAWWLL